MIKYHYTEVLYLNRLVFIIFIFIAVIALGFLLVALFRRLFHKKLSKPAHAVASIVLSLVIGGTGALVYLNIHYSAEPAALEAFSGGSGVTVTKEDYGSFFDGPGSETALVFYPGAKVDSEAYSRLMMKTAAKGVDCYLLNVPFRMAIFDANAADKVISGGKYSHYIVSGHSMGGVAASNYLTSNPGKADGLVLLASYSTTKVDDSVSVLSVYGSNDKVLNREAYDNAKSNLPKNTREHVIKGGNHAGFADYGEQSGDGKAEISSEAQQNETADLIIELSKVLY